MEARLAAAARQNQAAKVQPLSTYQWARLLLDNTQLASGSISFEQAVKMYNSSQCLSELFVTSGATKDDDNKTTTITDSLETCYYFLHPQVMTGHDQSHQLFVALRPQYLYHVLWGDWFFIRSIFKNIVQHIFTIRFMNLLNTSAVVGLCSNRVTKFLN